MTKCDLNSIGRVLNLVTSRETLSLSRQELQLHSRALQDPYDTIQVALTVIPMELCARIRSLSVWFILYSCNCNGEQTSGDWRRTNNCLHVV